MTVGLDRYQAYRAASGALREALLDDPFYRALAREAAGDGRLALLRYFDFSCFEADQIGGLTVWQGAVRGAAIWAKPGTRPETAQLRTAYLSEVLGPSAYAVYKAVASSMETRSAPYFEATDWYLSILGLDPAHRGKGLGADLVRPVLRQADAAGVGTFLETYTPGNMGFYRALGYEEVARIEEPVLGVPYHLMRRVPAGA